jgi:hypothetical protein
MDRSNDSRKSILLYKYIECNIYYNIIDGRYIGDKDEEAPIYHVKYDNYRSVYGVNSSIWR